MKVANVKQQMDQLRVTKVLSIVNGEFKTARKAGREYAKLAVNNFELVKQSTPIKGNIPLFSKAGFNCLKYMFLSMFYKKSPEEKQLDAMVKMNKYDFMI